MIRKIKRVWELFKKLCFGGVSQNPPVSKTTQVFFSEDQVVRHILMRYGREAGEFARGILKERRSYFVNEKGLFHEGKMFELIRQTLRDCPQTRDEIDLPALYFFASDGGVAKTHVLQWIWERWGEGARFTAEKLLRERPSEFIDQNGRVANYLALRDAVVR
jgi:hypothetical protein